MLITRIELENIKSYRHILVDLRRGTTAISGPNGAGKTTLVEAIGFALFGYLPYNHDQFVREGEKHGKIVIRLIGSDERPYTVERRCGSGARWLIHDEEADVRLEQRADVLDRLHDLFGIDRERPLDSLFRDALGVPQGTFTAIFLEPASKRKQTFDALLQIEDYKTASDNLLETQRYYKDQLQEQRTRINQLAFLTQDLDTWRAELQEARLIDEQQKAQRVQWLEQRARYDARHVTLSEQQNQLGILDQRFTNCRTIHANARNLLLDREKLLQAAQSAHQIVQDSMAEHQRYLQAQETLKKLRLNEQQRNDLRQKQAKQKNVLARSEEKARGWQTRLDEVDRARQQIITLAPLVEQQIMLEQRRDETLQKVERYQSVMAEGKRIADRLRKLQQDQTKYQQAITEIEPLQPLAEALPERNERVTQLRVQLGERNTYMLHFQEKQNTLREKQSEREQIAERLRRAEHNLAVIEEHRQEAEEMPRLQEQLEDLNRHRHHLEGNIEAYTDSREQSAGGQCPLLKETCLNIKQRGLVSLESYFDGLLTQERAEIALVEQQQQKIRARMEFIKKFSDALNKIGEYTAKRDTQAELLQRSAIEVTRLEREVTTLGQELENLKQVEQQLRIADSAFNESKQADLRVRELSGLRQQAQQVQEQIQQLETEIQELRREATQLQGCKTQLEQIKADLQVLNDPRGQSRAQQGIVSQEDQHRQQLQQELRLQQRLLTELQTLETDLAVYESLDADITQQETILQQSEGSNLSYLHNEKEAQRLPERQQSYQQQLEATAGAEQDLHTAERAYNEARAAFNDLELQEVREVLQRLGHDLSTLEERMQHHRHKITQLAQKIEESEKYLIELESARNEAQTLEDLQAMLDLFRKRIKEAGPHVLRAMLNDISAEANRIFGEVMGDRSARLSWHDEYEITLRRQGIERSFAQLSGGEQMSAALSVRLALLKKLSTLNVAFFDEPTQNMDELRRTNLAEQIRRVRGFDQLIVISHDDTFEQGLDSLVRLEKHHGETRLLADASVMANLETGRDEFSVVSTSL